MPYTVKQKFDINELIDIPKRQSKILLFITEENLSGIYYKYLQTERFYVTASNFGNLADTLLHLNTADLLVIDLHGSDIPFKMDFLKNVLRDFPRVQVITIGMGLEQELLENLMALGIVGHLDRRFSKPQDLVQMCRAIVLK